MNGLHGPTSHAAFISFSVKDDLNKENVDNLMLLAITFLYLFDISLITTLTGPGFNTREQNFEMFLIMVPLTFIVTLLPNGVSLTLLRVTTTWFHAFGIRGTSAVPE